MNADELIRHIRETREMLEKDNDEAAAREWARKADDNFCQCCGRKGIIGRFCRSCLNYCTGRN